MTSKPLSRQAVFNSDYPVTEVTPYELLQFVKIVGEDQKMPFELGVEADEASTLSRLRSPGKHPRVILWWQGIKDDVPSAMNGVYNWVFAADIQVPQMPIGVIPKAGQGVFSPALHATFTEVEKFLRSLRFESANISENGFQVASSGWVTDEEQNALLGHRIEFSIPVCTPSGGLIRTINLETLQQPTKDNNHA